jgi:hypothetical protein
MCSLAIPEPTPNGIDPLDSKINPATRAPILQAIKEQSKISRTSNSIANGDDNQSESQRWGSESSRTDGLADTRIYKQVAMAKLSTK